MTNNMTAEELNARERHRSSIVAKLHGDTPFDPGDTEASLRAAHLKITGEAYRTREEEQAAQLAEQRAIRYQEQDEKLEGDRKFLAFSKDAGFRDCLDIVKSWDISPYKWDATYRWITDAGEEVVYLLPDGGAYYPESGRITIPKSRRTGLYDAAYQRVTAYKDAHYARLRYDEWKTNMADAQAAKAAYGAQTALMDWDVYIESLGPEPPSPDIAILESVVTRVHQKEQSEHEARMAGFLSYEGPLTRKGKAPIRRLREHFAALGLGYIGVRERNWLFKEITVG